MILPVKWNKEVVVVIINQLTEDCATLECETSGLPESAYLNRQHFHLEMSKQKRKAACSQLMIKKQSFSFLH